MGIVKGTKEKGRLRAHFAKLREDLKPMTFGEKVDHIWTYYKYYALGIFCALCVVGGILWGLVAPQPELHIGGVQCNMELSTAGYDYLNKEFQATLGEKRGKTELRSFFFYGEATVDALTDTYKAHSSVTAYVEAQKLDYMFTDMYSFKYFAGDRILLDLRELLPAQELAELDAKGLILYEETEGSDEKVPRAINVLDMPFIRDHMQTTECYLVFIRNTPRKENCLKLWQHIKNYKGE